MCVYTVQPERNAQTKFSYNQFANLVAFGLHVNLARIWPNWLKTKFSPGVSFWLYCTPCRFSTVQEEEERTNVEK